MRLSVCVSKLSTFAFRLKEIRTISRQPNLVRDNVYDCYLIKTIKLPKFHPHLELSIFP